MTGIPRGIRPPFLPKSRASPDRAQPPPLAVSNVSLLAESGKVCEGLCVAASLGSGICKRFHRTVLDEFYRVAFRKKIYRTIDELQTDLDAWITEYNEHRPHQGRWCFGKTSIQTFLDALPLAKEKLVAA
jgi:hypothetical protein